MAKAAKGGAAVDKEIEALGWTIGRTLGEGAFGLVKLVTRNSDGQEAACKIMAKPKTAKEVKAIAMEYKIMTEMNHQYIVRCYEAKETDTSVFLFLELMSGGELFDKIIEMGSFTESMAADISYKLLGALNYMHKKGIIHRDLKPENMLLARKGDLSAVKLTDFGLSKMIDQQSQIMKTACGTPGYVAPEILTLKGGGYDHQVDVWSMGVIIYVLLCGFPPFYANNDAQLYAKIKACKYSFIKPHWDPISESAKDFIRRMLVVDPKQRASIDELLKHPWLAKVAKANDGSGLSGLSEMTEVDLRNGAEYHLKETEEKLAAQTKSLTSAVTLMRMQIRLARAFKKRAAERKAAGLAPRKGSDARPVQTFTEHVKEGQKFYQNTVTGESVWPEDLPSNAKVVQPAAEVVAPQTRTTVKKVVKKKKSKPVADGDVKVEVADEKAGCCIIA